MKREPKYNIILTSKQIVTMLKALKGFAHNEDGHSLSGACPGKPARELAQAIEKRVKSIREKRKIKFENLLNKAAGVGLV